MDGPNERLMQTIFENDLKIITLNKDIRVNKICRNGMTHLGAAAQTGNLALLKLLIDFHNHVNSPPNLKEKSKPQYLQLDGNNSKRCKNIGYFVVIREDDNEFGDGPTPEGMEGLEWDMEVNETSDFNVDQVSVDDESTNIYQWYAHILNRTSVLLESPERDLGRLDRHGQSVLHYAVHSGNIEMVDFLMDNFSRELSYEQNDSTGYSCIHKAVARGNINMVQYLINKGVNINILAGRHRQTPLHLASKMGHHAIMTLLIASGCNVNVVDLDDRTAMSWAVRQCDVAAVKILCEARSLVNSEEPGEITPLELAVYNGCLEIVKILLSYGARIIPSRHLLHKAITHHNLDMVTTLIEAGAMINVPDNNGYTPIMVACTRKNALILKYLIYEGGDVNAQSRIDGLTALHVCSQNVRSENNVNRLIEILVNSGANMNATCYQGTVLLHAIVLENICAAMALIRHGADVNLRDERLCWDTLSVSHRYGTLELCKATVYAGFNLRNMTQNPEKLRRGPEDVMHDFIMQIKTNPLNLREICRIVIRKHIGTNRLVHKIKKLPLPTIMQKYLSLEVLE